MRRLAAWLVLVVLAAAAACAPKTVPLPTVARPQFPDFIQPVSPPALASDPAAVHQERGWTFLQAGDFRNAEREAGAALKASPAFYPADALGGYIELAQKNARTAVARFDRALGRDRTYVPALVGKGQALAALNRDDDAVAVFEAALAVDPSLTDVARRVEVFKFRGLERELAAARQAARAGRLDEALEGYRKAIESSPDSPYLYREIGALERQKGDTATALEHFQKAVELDPSDAASLASIGEILDGQGDFDGALRAYDASLTIEPSDAVAAKRDAVKLRSELARLPEQYRAIRTAPQLTRGDLAALIGVRLQPLLVAGRGRDAGVVTDIRGHWAEPWILAVLSAGIMEPLPNHTFQPGGLVRRVDFAQVINRLLARVGANEPARARSWREARVRFTDLSSGHLAYPAVSAAVASGVLTTNADGSFQPSGVVAGADALAAIERLAALANLQPGLTIARP
jgi:tetratricopeptide (TPR) repeat protein